MKRRRSIPRTETTMNDANIPSKHEFVHRYTELLKRLKPLVHKDDFVAVVVAMNNHLYGQVPRLVAIAVRRGVDHFFTTVEKTFAESTGGVGGFQGFLPVDTEQVARDTRSVQELAQVINDWFATEEDFGGQEVVRNGLKQWDVTFDDPALASTLVGI